MEELHEITKNGRKYIMCKCSCGKIKPIRKDHVVLGKTISCGCLRDRKSSERTWKLHVGNTKTGLSSSPTYESWCSMKQRCNNPKYKFYSYYGGRGIKVCDRWANSFENFLADMGERPKGKTLDRKDSNGDYSPENCHWATRKEQQNNRRNCRQLLYKGNAYTLTELVEKFKLQPKKAEYWYYKGLAPDKIVETCAIANPIDKS